MSKYDKRRGKLTERAAKAQNITKVYSCLKYDHIDEQCLEVKKYNELHNKNYSYGEYTKKKRDGELEYPPPEIYNPPKDKSYKKNTKSK